MATLMSDEVFHEVAYRAKNRDHLLAGVDEFLDAVTVLPPGEWDPQYEFQKFHKWIRKILLFTYRVLFSTNNRIRIEPPAAIPSQVYY